MQNNNVNNSDRPKDTMIKFKGSEKKKNSKGGDYIVLKLAAEDQYSPEGMLTATGVETFIEELRKSVTERGVKLDIHFSDKVSNSGRPFLSAFSFVKGIQEPPAGVGGYAPRVSSGSAPQPVRGPAVSSDATRDAIAKLRKGSV